MASDNRLFWAVGTVGAFFGFLGANGDPIKWIKVNVSKADSTRNAVLRQLT